jgi:hypothetical protein
VRTNLLVAGMLVLAMGARAAADPVAESEAAREFGAFLARVDEAQVEFVQGRPAAFKALWSQGPDVSLFGGFGSGERGWAQVGPRLEWASAQFSKGRRTREVLASHVSGDLGFVVQLERIHFTVPGQEEETLLELRASMIARRESGAWRLVHRHADSQMKKQPPR